jgi:hypothetical protein
MTQLHRTMTLTATCLCFVLIEFCFTALCYTLLQYAAWRQRRMNTLIQATLPHTRLECDLLQRPLQFLYLTRGNARPSATAHAVVLGTLSDVVTWARAWASHMAR